LGEKAMKTRNQKRVILAALSVMLAAAVGLHTSEYWKTFAVSAKNRATVEETAAPADLWQDYEDFTATAYNVYGITYSGVVVRKGIVAADPQILPIGSVIEIAAGKYSGIYTVMDTGAVIKGNIIDIYLPDYEEAMRFGRQRVKVRVVRHGWSPEDSVPQFLNVAG
jgi:3D (Asp-Asp-Asp) domain-containing protein